MPRPRNVSPAWRSGAETRTSHSPVSRKASATRSTTPQRVSGLRLAQPVTVKTAMAMTMSAAPRYSSSVVVLGIAQLTAHWRLAAGAGTDGGGFITDEGAEAEAGVEGTGAPRAEASRSIEDVSIANPGGPAARTAPRGGMTSAPRGG